MNHINELINETSPYLLQHAHNPVNWYPWGKAAFDKARLEDKPIFLSIGYSTCHWCHVMARESFEDEDVADLMNKYFVCIKVDKEERPDIDGVYMRFCQEMTGSGGWPASIFITADGNPFFAGTYFPKEYFTNLLNAVDRAWKMDRKALLENGDRISKHLGKSAVDHTVAGGAPTEKALAMFRKDFDPEFGGFGSAPKFPSPHNLMFLLYTAPELAEKTLVQMYRGGILDHIGGGFSRYSTDRYWLVPHFEKMLYDNALLAMAYLMAYEKSEKKLYKLVCERVFTYLEREMQNDEGGFFTAQDADTNGEEGKYYLLTQDEIMELLGAEDGTRFCWYYGISSKGNFEGKNIPNLLGSPEPDAAAEAFLQKVYEYRRNRAELRTDKKVLTGWNCLTAAAYAMAARILKESRYLHKARETMSFIEQKLTQGDTVHVGITDGKRSGPGFLDDYACYIFALIQMHQVTMENEYLDKAVKLTEKAITAFWDQEGGGFFFSGKENESLVYRPKESFDGAIPSGNSLMAYNLYRLAMLTESEHFERWSEKQNRFMNAEASAYPMGYGFYLYSSLSVKKVVCVLKNPQDLNNVNIRSDWAFRTTNSADYPLVNDQTTYYVCEKGACMLPSNEIK